MINKSIDRYLQQNSAALHAPRDFTEMLWEFLSRSDENYANIAEAAQISKSTLSRIISRKTAVPSRDTALALGMALHLTDQEMTEFLRARDVHDGFPADKRDFLILYHVRNRKHSLVDVNITLSEYGCELLCG